jgi:CRP/FNR family cyclic AMP-dependent transcriptional regulator
MISTVEKVLFLKSHDLFSQISGEDLAQIAQITDEVHFEEGDVLFQEGEQGDSLFLVITGQIRIHQGGRQIAIVAERGVTGEMALLDSEPRSASGSALTDLTLLKITRDDFNEILAEKVEIAQQIIKVLTRRQRETNQRLREMNDEITRLNSEVERLGGKVDRPATAPTTGDATPEAA